MVICYLVKRSIGQFVELIRSAHECIHWKTEVFCWQIFIPKFGKVNFHSWKVNLWWQLSRGKLKMRKILEHCEKIQLNMSKNAGEKSGKLCISSILSPKRDITPTKTDTHWRHLKLTCSTVKQSHVQNFSSICQSV